VCAAAVAIGAGALAACSASNSANFGSATGEDAGGTPFDGGPSFDGTAPSDAFGEEDVTAPPPPTVTFVHASPSLSNARLCWAVTGAGGATTVQTTTDLPFPSGAPMPESNFPGLPVGGAVQLSPATELAREGATSSIELYAIDALVLARQTNGATSCRDLVCLQNPSLNPSGTCLRPNKDYWHAGTIPPRAIAGSGPTFVALAGCEAAMPDPAANATRCGADWDSANGNLHVEVLHVTSIPEPDAGALAIQSALLSPPLAGMPEGGIGTARIAFGQAGGDAGASQPLGGEGQVVPTFPTLLTIGTDLAAFGTLGFEVDGVARDGAAPLNFWMSLAQAQSLVDPAADPRLYFGANSTYLVAVIGDPTAPSPFLVDGGTYDGRGLHVLVLASLPAP
jgi:hypothetical protein